MTSNRDGSGVSLAAARGRGQAKSLGTAIPVLLGAVLLLMRPDISSEAVTASLRFCAEKLIAALFPFSVISSLLVSSGLAVYLGGLVGKPVSLLFGVDRSCASALLLGSVSGFPCGADCAVRLYLSGYCSERDAERLIAFASNAGPAFVIGAVGAGILGNAGYGAIIYLSQLAAAFFVGILTSFPRAKRIERPNASPDVKLSAGMLVSAVSSAAMSMLNIVGCVCFFSVVSAYFSNALKNIAGLGIGAPLLDGFFEFSSGMAEAALLRGRTGITLCALIAGWSGLSVWLQCLTIARKAGLSGRSYLPMKAAQSLLSAFFAFGVCLLIKI